MGRNAKHVSLLKGHRSKAELAARQGAEIKLGHKDIKRITPPDYVKNNLVAFDKWQKLLVEYKEAAKNGIEIISTSDIGVLANYCITYSEYLALIDRRNRLDQMDLVAINHNPDDDKKIKGERRVMLNECLRLQYVLKLETAINKKHDLLIKLEDRLFLNPLAKSKNVPRKEKPKFENPMEKEFDI